MTVGMVVGMAIGVRIRTTARLPVAGAAALALVMSIALFAGCAGGDGPLAPPPDRTDGLVLELYVVRAGASFARYRVERTGTLSFGGGFQAQNGAFTWTGPLTDDEIRDLRGLIEAHGWAGADPPSTGEPPETRYTIELRMPPNVRKRFRVTGENPAVTPVHDLLERAARRRNSEFLDTLPRPAQAR